jgi:hypothetical protein
MTGRLRRVVFGSAAGFRIGDAVIVPFGRQATVARPPVVPGVTYWAGAAYVPATVQGVRRDRVLADGHWWAAERVRPEAT